MNKYISILLLIPITGNSMTFKHAESVYYKVAGANSINPPPLKLNPSREVNASYTNNGIYLNSGILSNVRNDNEIALVLGHELAHGTLHHSYSSPSHEFAADALGGRYMMNAGYNECSGAKMFLRWNEPASNSHPDSISRYNRLCGQGHQEFSIWKYIGDK